MVCLHWIPLKGTSTLTKSSLQITRNHFKNQNCFKFELTKRVYLKYMNYRIVYFCFQSSWGPPSWTIVTWNGCFIIRQKLFVSERSNNQDTSQLFKMAAPRKFKNKNTRFWNSFLSTKDTLLENVKTNVITNTISCRLNWLFGRSGGSL